MYTTMQIKLTNNYPAVNSFLTLQIFDIRIQLSAEQVVQYSAAFLPLSQWRSLAFAALDEDTRVFNMLLERGAELETFLEVSIVFSHPFSSPCTLALYFLNLIFSTIIF
jgi:hypothetical protein